MAVEFAKLYATNGKLIYDDYFQRIKECEECRNREQEAATLIQLTWHQYKERKYRKLLLRAVIKIQKIFRGYISRMRTKKRILEENELKHKQYYNERAILIQKIWRGYHSRKAVFDYYAYKQYLKDVTEYTFKVNEEINRHAEEQRKQMESEFLENEEKKIQDLAGKIHHLVSTKMIDGVCKYPNMELYRIYRDKAYENELKRVSVLPPTYTSKVIYNNRKMSPISKIPIRSASPSKNSLKNSSQRPKTSDSNSNTLSTILSKNQKNTVDTPSTFYTFSESGLTEKSFVSYDSNDSLLSQDIYMLNEQDPHMSIANTKEYTGYEFEHFTDILKRKEKLLPPISSIPESVIQNSEALKEWKKNNINRPKSMIPLRKEIVYKEDIPPEYLQKKANGPFLPTYLLNRKLKGPDPAEASLRNQTTIYETPNKLKEERIEKNKKILHGSFKLNNHHQPLKHTKALDHDEPWIQPKDPNTIISETEKFTGKHDFRTRLTTLCYDAYKEDFK